MQRKTKGTFDMRVVGVTYAFIWRQITLKSRGKSAQTSNFSEFTINNDNFFPASVMSLNAVTFFVYYLLNYIYLISKAMTKLSIES